jgi:hypothetical protein
VAGWCWADRGEGEKDGVARKGEEKRERSFFFTTKVQLHIAFFIIVYLT